MFDIKDAKIKYVWQKKRAKRRNIPFEISFDDWCNLWISSGKWEQRGLKKGQYVMSRINDTGPYAVDNVIIKTSQENVSEGTKNKPRTKEWIDKIRQSNIIAYAKRRQYETSK